jgi:hypothetical protein
MPGASKRCKLKLRSSVIAQAGKHTLSRPFCPSTCARTRCTWMMLFVLASCAEHAHIQIPTQLLIQDPTRLSHPAIGKHHSGSTCCQATNNAQCTAANSTSTTHSHLQPSPGQPSLTMHCTHRSSHGFPIDVTIRHLTRCLPVHVHEQAVCSCGECLWCVVHNQVHRTSSKQMPYALP